MPKHLKGAVTALVAALALGFTATTQAAEFETFEATVSDLQAGGHPDLQTQFSFELEQGTTPGAGFFDPCLNVDGTCMVVKGGSPKDIVVDLPAGIVGNPKGLPQCTIEQLLSSSCSPATQVGISTPILGLAGITATDGSPGVFNMSPRRGELARIGMAVLGLAPIMISFEVRPADGGLIATVDDLSTMMLAVGNDLRIWGIPGSPSHDPERVCANNISLGCPIHGFSRVRAYLANTADCASPLRFFGAANAWQDPQSWDEVTHELGAPTGCETLRFTPGTDFEPTSRRSDSPTGLDVEITVPQTWEETESAASVAARSLPLATPPLRRAEVTLPEGMSISPGQADGLGACTDAQANVGSDEPMSCPSASRIGNVEVVTPLLDDLMTGGIYLGTQQSNDPESGEMYRMFIEIQNAERGISLRLPGKIVVDPDTGQVKTIVDEAPQLPFETMRLHFKGGPRGVLANPPTCGIYKVKTELTSWATGMAPVVLNNEFVVDRGPDGGPCLAGDPSKTGSSADRASRPFSPRMSSGVLNPVAGSKTPFVFRLTRPDGHQEISLMTVEPPEGVSGYLKGIPLCSDAGANAGNCPAASQVGRAISGAGAGSAPFYVPEGDVFLTGPYKGAPLGLLVKVPAVAGPFDLGEVDVRAAIHVDRRTAQLRVVSDPLPQMLKGVPLRLRDIRILMDREGFGVAPTDCSEKQVLATVHGSHGATAKLSNRFQVGGCAGLSFRPQIRLALKGRRQTKTGGHPALRARVRQAGTGEAGIRRAVVRLPKSLALDPDNARALCEFGDGTKPDLEEHCPEGSIVGRARAHTPLLDRPLVGNVYFVKRERVDPSTGARIRTLPMIVAALRGEIAINLVGHSKVRNGSLVSVFGRVPDAPITRFNLNLKGGGNGILVVTETARGRIDLCTNRQIARTGWAGQNGKRRSFRTRVATPCGAKKPQRRLRLRR